MISHSFRHVCRIRCSRESCERALRATVDRYDVPVDLRKLPLWSPAHGNWTNHVVYAQGNESLILRAACSEPTIYKQWIYLNKHPTPSDHLASLSALSDKFILDRQSFRSSQLTEASAIPETVTNELWMIPQCSSWCRVKENEGKGQ